MRLERDGLSMSWDPQRRVVTFVHTPAGLCTHENAVAFSQQMDAWVGDLPFDVLVCAEGADRITRAWRSVWASAFRRHSLRARIAIHGADRTGRLVISVWAFAVDADIRFFADEAAASAWLATPRASSRATPHVAS